MRKKFDVTITYLEQTEKPLFQPAPQPPGKMALMRAEQPPVHFYRYLFDQVGGPYHWVSRRYMSDTELLDHIHDEAVHVFVLYFNGVPCGMGEIDTREESHDPGTAEIKFFGLMQDYIGKGLGRWFFNNILDLAWSFDTNRVVLETCTADHPVALTFYQKMGFSVYARGNGIIEWRG